MKRIIYLLLMFVIMFAMTGCKKKYTITFDSDGGSAVAEMALKKGSPLSQPDDPVKEGYDFQGWFLEGVAYVFDQMPSENITLKAKWAIKTFTVTFKNEDGTVLETETVEYGKGATAPDEPAKEGYAFSGWDKVFSKVTQNLEVKAEFVKNQYTITFDSDGGSLVDSITKYYGDAVEAPADPVKEGYIFIDWFLDNVAYTFEQMPPRDITLVALWEMITYTVTFQNDDETVFKAETVEYGHGATAPDAPVREGYTFTGWDKDFTQVSQDLVVKAVYSKNQYTITFDSNGGSAVEKLTPYYGDTVEAPADPVKEGMRFLGWYLDDVLYVFDKMPAQNLSLLAKWEESGTEGLDFSLKADNTYAVVGYFGTSANVVIPNTYYGIPVSTISYNAFANNKEIESLYIPSGITKIEKCIDSGSSNLASHVIDENNPVYKSVDNNIYSKDDTIFYSYTYGQTADAFTIPSTVNIIEDYAFSFLFRCAQVTIPASVQEIGEYAFAFSPILNDVYIPNSVYKLEKGAFYYCTNLYNLTLNPGVQFTGFEPLVFAGCPLTAITFPLSVKYIGDYAFWGCHFTNVVIPDGITSIGIEAFCNCLSLTNIVVPASVTYIGNDAFFSTPWFNQLPDGITYINDVLYKCIGNLSPDTDVVVREGTVSISPRAFYGSDLVSITIPDTVITIGDNAFQYCTNLTDVVLPGQLKKISNSLFSYCSNLANVTMGNAVETIGDNAFEMCHNLVSLDLSDTLVVIGYRAFADCLILSDISLPSGLREIRMGAFTACHSLISLFIPLSVTDIQSWAFDSCYNLTLYVETLTLPEGWLVDWNISNCPVSWGCQRPA